MQKRYVLDTNILLASPNAILGFSDNEVLITATTLQELDSKKSAVGELGKHARDSIRAIDSYRAAGDLMDGVDLENGGRIRIINYTKYKLPESFKETSADNRILAAICEEMTNDDDETPVILVTNDVSFRINASILGIPVESYRNDHIASEKPYWGRREIEMNKTAYNKLVADGNFPTNNYMVEEPFVENEFIKVNCENSDDFCLAIIKNDLIETIPEGNTRAFGVIPKNNAQACAIYALTDPEIPLVILKGEAGTAKTFLSLAAGLEQTYNSKFEREYSRILISRNNVLSDAEFGFLPGDLEEKMSPLLAPFYDNLETLLGGEDETPETVEAHIEDLFFSKVIDICPLAYMRGRSITHSFLIVDEVQNATPTQIRDIITRAGAGTKIILCGDPNQIDNPRLDKFNNGLVYAAEKMKNSPLCAQITFDKEESVRSELAKEAIRRM